MLLVIGLFGKAHLYWLLTGGMPVALSYRCNVAE